MTLAHAEFRLAVGDGHELAVYTYGNPEGGWARAFFIVIRMNYRAVSVSAWLLRGL